MSLANAVSMVVSAMEQEAKGGPDCAVDAVLARYAGLLRVALAAAGGERQPEREFDPVLRWDQLPPAHGGQFPPPPDPGWTRLDPAAKGLTESNRPPLLDRAAEVVRVKLKAEDTLGERMAVCVGGPAAGDTVPLNPGMPTDAYAVVGGGVYQLRADGQMHYDEGQTKTLAERGA